MVRRRAAARVPRDGRGRSQPARPSRSAFRCSSCSGRTTSSAATPGRSSRARSARATTVTVWPSGRATRVKRIVTWDGDLESRASPMSVTLTLEDEIDISRGDMHRRRRHRGRPAVQGRCRLDGRAAARSVARVSVEAHHADGDRGSRPRAGAESDRIGDRLDGAADHLRPLRENRGTGSFILIDPATNFTAGAGMIAEACAAAMPRRRAAERGRAAGAAGASGADRRGGDRSGPEGARGTADMSHQMQSVPASGDVPVSGNDLALCAGSSRPVRRRDPAVGGRTASRRG